MELNKSHYYGNQILQTNKVMDSIVQRYMSTTDEYAENTVNVIFIVFLEFHINRHKFIISG